MKPQRIILVRHGQSLEDIDNTVYREIQDREIPLTDTGIRQIKSIIPKISQNILGDDLHIWHCSSVRIKQSVDLISKGLTGFNVFCFEDQLLAKQNWGTVTIDNRSFHEQERYKTGVLKYRFPNGETGTDVVKRTRRFLERLFARESESCSTHLLCNHGFLFRILSTLLTGWNEEYFLCLANPKYAQIRVLDYNPETDTYRIDKPMKLYNKNENKFHIDAKR